MSPTKRLILIALGFCFCIAILAMVSRSSVVLTVQNSHQSDYTYHVVNQSSGKDVASGSSSSATKKLVVPYGLYEVNITQGTNSYVTVVQTKRLPFTTAVAVDLQPEKSREFVGDNPSACMNMLGAVLFSSDCGLTSDVKIHVPAADSRPTSVDTTRSPLGHLEDAVSTKQGDLALFATSAGDNNIGQAQVVYKYRMVGTTIQPTDHAILAGLDPNTTFKLLPYHNGFIAYDSTYLHISYYSSLHANPQPIAIERPKYTNLGPISISAWSNGDVVTAYSTLPSKTESDAPAVKSASEIVWLHDGASQHFVSNKGYSAALLCGDSKLCLLRSPDNLLEIKQLDGKKLKTNLTLRDVQQIAVSGNGVAAVRSADVLYINGDTLTGQVDYSFGSYHYCGIQQVNNGYVLCVIGSDNQRMALFTDRTRTDTSTIDKKIRELDQLTEISTLSIYGHYIFIVPHGPTVFDLTTNSYGPDPTVQPGINKIINDEIDSLGIDRKIYHITITTPSS